MKRYLFQILLNLCLLTMAGTPVYGLEAGSSAQRVSTTPLSLLQDQRVAKLEGFLESHNSPLAPYSAIFIAKADQYNLSDWRLIPAITGVESTFGKVIPINSYNAYGWANGAHSFANWEQSIDEVTKTIKQKYIDRGLDTPEKMSHIYAPPSHTWAGKVRFLMDKIERYMPVSSESLAFTL